MRNEYNFRPATIEDAGDIARLIAISSDGVAMIEWKEEADQQGCTAVEIGEHTYRGSEGNYSWKNSTIVEADGQVAGMLLTFACPGGDPREPDKRPAATDANVFAPYMYLEEPDSWYICGVALYPEFRGQGLGTRLMNIAREQGREKGFAKLSLVAFQQNSGSVSLYQRLGYRVVDHAPIVPHPLIHYNGEALLMVAELNRLGLS